MATKKFNLVAFSVALFFAACGNDSENNTTGSRSSDIEIVPNVASLPECTRKNEGEMAWVKGETSARVCVDEKWYAAKADTDNFSCTTAELSDKSGVKIVCGGDSVGVVLNGKNGENGTNGKDGNSKDGKDGINGTNGKDGINGTNGKDGKSCTAITLADNSGLKIVCGDDSVGVVLNGHDGVDGKDGVKGDSGAIGPSGVGCSMEKVDGITVHIVCGIDTAIIFVGNQSNIILDSEKVSVSTKELSGVVQKGPFLTGSKIIIHEIKDGCTLAKTDNSFRGKILNDKGEFKLTVHTLESQYVVLEATGLYYDEITGENVSSELTLYAITDINNRNVVNVNLLTHLEYKRVMYLVTQKNMKVRDAKKQAQKEIFKLLDIDATDFSNSEDLNIAGISDEDGALLAFSLMLLGNRSSNELSTLLQSIANDIEEDGLWEDAATRVKIAEWSADADSANFFAKIHQNMKKTGYATIASNIERLIRNFWYKEYGLDSCKTEGLVKAATVGKRKGTKTRYICKDADDLGNMRWVIANDFEKDTYGWKDTTDGAFKNGAVTEKKYVFDATGSANGTKGWRLAIDTQICTEGDDGFSKWEDSIGVVSGSSKLCYVYDTSAVYGGWRIGNNLDCTLGLFGCTEGRTNTILMANDGNYYNCSENTWSLISDHIKINTNGWKCLDENEGEIKKSLINDAYFVCDSNKWRDATTNEDNHCRNNGLCIACTDRFQGVFETRNNLMYVCDLKSWRQPNCAEKVKQSMCTTNDSSVVWECEDVASLCAENDSWCLENAANFKVDYICSYDTIDGEYKLMWHPIKNPYEYTLRDWKKKKKEYYTAEKHPDAEYGEDFTDSRDSNVYKTVIINGIRVFAENLRYADSITSVNLKGNSWCYNNEAKNCEIGGRYYTWAAALDLKLEGNYPPLNSDDSLYQGICPTGWHIPTILEWIALLSGVDYAKQQMMGFNDWSGATDVSGFSALPVGYNRRRNYNKRDYNAIGQNAYFWSSCTASGYNRTEEAGLWALRTSTASYSGFFWHEGLSIRCIENN